MRGFLEWLTVAALLIDIIWAASLWWHNPELSQIEVFRSTWPALAISALAGTFALQFYP